MADSKSITEQKPRSKSDSSYSPGAGGMDTSPTNLPKPIIAKQHSRPLLPPKRSAPPIPPRRTQPSGPKTKIPSAHPETNQPRSTSASDTSFVEKPSESSIKGSRKKWYFRGDNQHNILCASLSKILTFPNWDYNRNFAVMHLHWQKGILCWVTVCHLATLGTYCSPMATAHA